MHPISRDVIGRILAPRGGPPPAPATKSTRMTIQQIVWPSGAPAGPERPVPIGVVAEVVDAPPAVVPPPRAG